MDTSTIARENPNGKTSRYQRGIALALEHFEEIVRIRPWEWQVPSGTGSGFYLVNLKHGCCNCPDRMPEGERCKHETAARYVKGRTGTCSGCSRRFRHRDLHEVGEDNLTFFEGDIVCRECACAHGVL